MNEKFVIIKIKLDNREMVERLIDSESYKIERYYNVQNDYDKRQLEEFEINQNLNLVFLVYTCKTINSYTVDSLYIGKGKIVEHKGYQGSKNICYQINYISKSELIIHNFLASSGIDIIKDFEDYSYIILENANIMYKKLIESISTYDERELFDHEMAYGMYTEVKKSVLYQKNEYCKRYYSGIKNSNTEDRSEFQRDRERILHSKAFRRLVDKAQIFTSNRGDHFRTRMTHTLEVSQIARGLARKLGVNEDLTEAIALAHDIGHTPFGHQGERTLETLMSNELSKIPFERPEVKRFKHNFQGIKVVSCLEEKYLEYDGLNLSYQVLEGILKHTNSCSKNKPNNCECDHGCVDLNDFLINGEKQYLYPEYKYPTTVEGQIVRIADEIAQRGHDLDDAFASRLLSYDNFKEICSIRKFEKIRQLIDKIEVRATRLENNNRYFIELNDVIRAELVSGILGILINDVAETSIANMNAFDTENRLFIEEKRVNELLVRFSSDMDFIVNYLEDEIKKKVISSNEVAIFDDSAERIITRLFNSYLNNPKLLPNSVLRRLFYEYKKNNLSVIDFRDGELKLVSEELKKIKTSHIIDKNNLEYNLKFEILIHCIVDHISGMTDNFAINEYKKLE